MPGEKINGQKKEEKLHVWETVQKYITFWMAHVEQTLFRHVCNHFCIPQYLAPERFDGHVAQW